KSRGSQARNSEADVYGCHAHGFAWHAVGGRKQLRVDEQQRMSRIDTLFQKLRAEKRKALMPFVTAGDPDLEFTAAVLRELAARGSSLCEVGIPYSDPIADGPVIQASYTRALDKKVKLSEILAMLAK